MTTFANTFPLFLLLFHLTQAVHTGKGIPEINVVVPPSHIALSGDLNISIGSSSFLPLVVQLSRLEGNKAQPLTTFPVYPEAGALKRNLTVAKIQCGYFSKGGQYYIQIKRQPILGKNSTSDWSDSDVIVRSLDVRWPMPQLSLTPEHVQTYPESPVTAILTFPEVVCPPVVGTAPSAIPEFWLELHYCGHSLLTCDNTVDSERAANKTDHQVLYSEQVRGLPGRSVFILRCELFGRAGHYALMLRPTNLDPVLPRTAAYVKAEWSEQFVFNVHARSIFPCDPHGNGITVLFQYPSCILAIGDRVRIYGRLRANVASLSPPTTLEYITEQKINRGQHSLHFDCEIFTEHYVEYCFVYVSQSISGAVDDVRIDCVPTLPVTDQESGGWGRWSEWTACSSTCIGGIRTRYRFCDSPPPRYGAKFCEGDAVETEKCGVGLGSGWECFYSGTVSGNDVMAAQMREVTEEVSPYCRCGCVVHLGEAKRRRFLTVSSQSCPGRTFWLIEADHDSIIQFRVEQFYLPCGNQWLKIRDGRSLSANLLADLTGEPGSTPSVINSTGPDLLLDFYTDEVTIGGQLCAGGFLAESTQLKNDKYNITLIPVAQSVGVIPAVVLKLTAVHIAAIFFLSGLILATVSLGTQYLFRYRKYHIAQAEDQESLGASSASIPLTARAQSNATLLSEVISLTKLRPLNIKVGTSKHVRLRESMDCDRDQEEVTLAKEEDSLSASTATLTAQNDTTATTAPNLAVSEADDVTPTVSLPTSPHLIECYRSIRRSSTSASEKDRSTEKGGPPKGLPKAVFRRVGDVTLTNGCYSSASSMVSTATIRSTNAKATKDKRNREKLLAGPTGSEFSIAGQDTDLEFDYYDYNVVNAGAAPGSYLGMDPAFLVWIPPLDESGEILPPEDQEYHELEDIAPKVYIDPGSNKESPEEESLLPKSRTVNEAKTKVVYPLVHGTKRNREVIDNRYLNEAEPLVNNKIVEIQLHEFPKKLRTQKLSKMDMEKETEVQKSPSIDEDEIRFADDDDEDDLDLNEMQCNNENVSYQDSNVLSSS
ncbi:uncharacterized protein LOC132700756 isoform X2 [Cylas formicarius]|uniref:uncharacterized protein LOC132700756 isoform X2 n=1 Tax=Cylas formicarius TaxID=197179 RepID=UPI0029586947|nr:uncharacterized protein LOC132700756 isoform X2 [Cylas formicarius]